MKIASILLSGLSLFFVGCTIYTSGDLSNSVSVFGSDLDKTMQPGDDFYRFVNNKSLKKGFIPKGYSRYGALDILRAKQNQIIRTLLEEAGNKCSTTKNDEEKIIGCFYRTAMDSLKNEQNSFTYLQRELNEIDQIQDKKDLDKIVYSMHRNGNWVFFTFFAQADPENNQINIGAMHQAPLNLPDLDFYFNPSSYHQNVFNQYNTYLKEIVSLAGYNEKIAKRMHQNFITTEMDLARVSSNKVKTRSIVKSVQKQVVKEIVSLYPSMPLKKYFIYANISKNTQINVLSPQYFERLDSLIENSNLTQLKDYMKVNLISKSSNYLSHKFFSANFQLYGKNISGKSSHLPRHKRVISTMNSLLGDAIGKQYSQKYFSETQKEDVIKMVEQIIKTFETRIENLDWMCSGTKKRAIDKLKNTSIQIGYPDKWTDYSKLEITGESMIENVFTCSQFLYDSEMKRIGKKVVSNQWPINAHSINAFYDPATNAIIFPAGILQAPFYEPDWDPALNYGAIGVVIAHELTHGFDDQGRHYNAFGQVKDWWENEDVVKFKEKTDRLVKYYDGFKINDSIHTNGALTLGENLADLGGILIAYDALRDALGRRQFNKKINQLRSDQRFFIAYASIWYQLNKEEEMIHRTITDVHPLGMFRVNGPLPHIDAFYEAFRIKPSNTMYIRSEERIRIW